MWTRNGAAAGLFAVLGLVVAVLAIVDSNPILGVLAVVAFIAAAASTRGYPIDNDW